MAPKLPKADVLDALLDAQSSGEEEEDEENVLYRSLEDILNDSDDEEDTCFADMESSANNRESDVPREINLGNSQQLDESLGAVSKTFDLYNSSSQEVNDAVLQKEPIFTSQVTQNLEIESRKSLYAISSLLPFGSNNPKPGAALAAAALAAAASVSRQQNGKHPASIPLTREISVRQDDSELIGSHQNNMDQQNDRALQMLDAEVLHSVGVGNVVFSIEKPEELKAMVPEIPETLQVGSKICQDGEAAELDEGAIGEFDQLESCSDKCQDSDQHVSLDMQIEKLAWSSTESISIEESNLDAGESNDEIDDLQVKGYSDQSHGEQASECQMPYLSSKLEEVVGKDTEGEADIKKIATFQSHSQALGSLHNAEDQERLAASFRSNWEVGAAAQPMRLEGIHQHTPAVGLLQTRIKRPLLHSLASPAMRQDHGSPLSLAVHMNFLAIGMSRGTILVSPNKHSATRAKENEETKALFLGNASDKAQVGTTALCFNHSADMLLSGFSNGSLTLWDLPKVSMAKVISGEHNAAIVHVVFVGRSLKAVTADCKGVVLVHTFTMMPLLRRFSVMTQCLLDGQHNGIVLGLSSLVPDEYSLGSTGTMSAAGNDAGKKILYDGNLANEAKGMMVLVTRKVALVVRLGSSLEVCAKLERPQGVDEWSVPYAAWRRPEMSSAPNGIVKSDNPSTMTKKSLDGGENVLEGSSENGAIEEERAPILALVWGRKVLITQLLKAELKVLTAWDLDRVATGIGWLNEQILIICTTNGEVLLFTKEGIKLEEVCIDSTRDVIEPMVYHTHYVNSVGNPEKAYHNSFGVRGAEVFLLQPHGLWTGRLLPWQDRIAVLQEAGDWLGAFHLAMELYDGKAKGVTGLPRGMVTMQEAIMPTLMSLLSAYIDEAFAYIGLTLAPSSQPADLSNKKSIVDGQPLESRKAIDALEATKEQYARVGGVAVEFCLHIGRTDILFQNVFQKFETVGRKDVFLELLEPYILKDMLHGLAPEIMQCLVEHYSSKGWLQRVEQCILHMDITSLDFNQVVKLCREHGLFSALTYLFNKGLDDYTSPLEEFLAVAQDSEKPNAQAFGYKLLVYLKYCFLGLAFPPGRGVIEQSLLPALRARLVEYLIDPEGVPRASKVNSTEVMSVGPYGRIIFLLKLDAAATLHVLKLAFIEDEALSADKVHLGLANCNEFKAFNIDPVNFITNGTFLIQSVIDAFVHIVETVPCKRLDMDKDEELSDVGSNGSTNTIYEDAASLSVLETGQLFEFIASFLASGYGSVPKRSFLRILHYLASEGLGVQDRENLMVAMLTAVPGSDWDASDVLQIAEQAKFWQVIALIFRQKGDYNAALSSYMKDNFRPLQTFKFILQVMGDDIQVTDLAEFRELVLAQYLQLVNLSSEAACILVLKHFSQQNDVIVGKLKPHPEVLFKYLKTMIDIYFSSIDMQKIENDVKYREDIDNIANILGLVDVKGEQINTDIRSRLAKLLWQSHLEISDDLIELYLELLCQFRPSSVLQFLQKFENYRLEYCLKLCQEYHVNDAAAFLLERVGDVGSAVSLILKDLEMHLHKMKEAVISISNSCRLLAESIKQTIFKIPEVVDVYSILDSAIAICQRNTLRLDQREAEGLWFHLLDRFASFLHTNLIGFKSSKVIMHKHRDTETCAGVIVLRQLLSKFTGDIINGMIGYVPAHIIMNKLLFKHGNHEFADFKGSILEILSLYGYELAILGTAKKVIENETFLNIMTLKRRYSQGYVAKFSYCCLCEKDINECADEYASKLGVLNKETDMKEVGVRIFCCGHVVHIACMETVNSDVAMQCPICLQRNVTGLFSMDKRKCAQEHGKSKVFSSNKYQENVRRQMVQASNSLEPSRFELLKDLQSRESSDGLLPRHSLKLSPPSQRPRLRSKYVSPSSTKSTPPSTSWTAKFPSIRALSNIGGNHDRQK